MRPLVQDVLIGFVTTSDPGTDRGPASIITVAKAKLPQVIYLLYTDATRANRDALLEWFRADSELANLAVPDWPKLDLPDVTDYEKLAALLSEELKKISKNHPGAHFHLVSGLPQARLIFALCLNARLLSGTLWEVNPPEPPKPRPPLPPQGLDKEACEQRLERWPTAIFDAFRSMFVERYKAVRLRLNLQTEQAWLDDRLLGLRASARPRSERELVAMFTSEEGRDIRPRTFQTLVLLAAKKRYGLGDDRVPKPLISQTAYSDQREAHAAVNIRRALGSINRQARRITELTGRAPLDPLILDVKRGGRPIGIYRLTDKLNPPDETIEFVGDVRDYLQKMGIAEGDLPSLFPDLPPPAAQTHAR